MKIIPKSMLARTAWVLGIGFILMIADGIFVVKMLLNSESKSSTYYEFITRVKIITQLTSTTERSQRSTLLNSLNEPQLEILWAETEPDQADLVYDWATKKMNKHLMHFMHNQPVKQIMLGHPKPPPSNSFDQQVDKEKFVLSMQLTDNSWLQFKGRIPNKHRTFVTNVIAIFIVFIVSIFLIALLISRQIIKPLRGFSNAAITFSVDINSVPLAETGPTEIIQTARAFNIMQKRISNFVNERMQIIAAISHDLRTPLTRLRLRFESIETLPDHDKIMSDIKDMQTMLDSTLAFAKDDSKQETRKKVNLTSLLQTICDDNADTGGVINCSLQPGIEYKCGPVALKRAINNIIENAQRYGEYARIELNADTDSITIKISDKGPGIPEEEQQKVLNPFYRIEKSRNKDTGGSGLGLTVAKTIISAHGGEIILKNAADVGLMVIITLPN